MRQERSSFRTRRKRCLCCRKLFAPSPRTKGHQRYCSNPACQTKRQRQNEFAWRRRNPDCLERQLEQSRKWHRTHPDYSRKRRAANSVLIRENRNQTKLRMRKIRSRKMFDKSKVILTQLVKRQGVKCYLTAHSKWLMMRLTKASPLSKLFFLRDNHAIVKRVSSHLPRGRLYDLSGIF
jgi:hypothetical protein